MCDWGSKFLIFSEIWGSGAWRKERPKNWTRLWRSEVVRASPLLENSSCQVSSPFEHIPIKKTWQFRIFNLYSTLINHMFY
jgi:hypothetical protein